MEYVKFKKPISITDILILIKQISKKYDYNNLKLGNMIVGVSNDLLDVDFTLSYVEKIKNLKQISKLTNGLILTNKLDKDKYEQFNIIEVEDSRYVFMKLIEKFKNDDLIENFTSVVPYQKQYISKTAKIHFSSTIEDGVIIEDNVIVCAGCVIKAGTFIGKGSIIRENTTIGCDGISLYKALNGEVLRFPHVAGVMIGKNVEIGSNSVVVRGTLVNTVIGDSTVIGNLTNIGHGVKIGKKVWISVGGMIGGNTIIKDQTTIGLGVSIKNNISIGVSSTIGMGSVVTKSIDDNKNVFGNPAKIVRSLNVGPKR